MSFITMDMPSESMLSQVSTFSFWSNMFGVYAQGNGEDIPQQEPNVPNEAEAPKQE
jgi:hypothetical protein